MHQRRHHHHDHHMHVDVYHKDSHRRIAIRFLSMKINASADFSNFLI